MTVLIEHPERLHVSIEHNKIRQTVNTAVQVIQIVRVQIIQTDSTEVPAHVIENITEVVQIIIVPATVSTAVQVVQIARVQIDNIEAEQIIVAQVQAIVNTEVQVVRIAQIDNTEVILRLIGRIDSLVPLQEAVAQEDLEVVVVR